MGLTVVGEHLAKPGLVFRYEGETDPGCGGCRLYKACHQSGLRKGREYRIMDVRPVQHAVCHVFEGKVQLVAVEPEPLPVKMAIPVSATRGTGVSKRWEECGASCLLKQYCNPPALQEGQTAQLLDVQGDVACLVGRKLKLALVKPA